MKKFLSAFALLAVILLTACDDDASTIVCTLEEEEISSETTIHIEDGYVVSTVTESTEYAPGTTEEELDFIRNLAMEGMEFELDGDYIRASFTMDFEDGIPLDEVIEDLETEGFDCN